MTATAQPASTPVSAYTDRQVEWFAHSTRIVGNRPDSRYGWLVTAQGPCIVKALDRDLVPYADALLQHERRALRRLQEFGAPAPELVDLGRPDWLVTRFAGLSLALLTQGSAAEGTVAPARFTWHEQVSTWVHLLRRLQPMGDAGVLALDLYSGNVLVPLTQGVRGQLRLNAVTTVDHAHTLEAGMDLRRPVWLDAGMPRIAPELRAALESDQRDFRAACAAADVDLPSDSVSRMPAGRDAANRRFWARYDAPQQLQRLLDRGTLSAALAMQFAAGTSIARLVDQSPDRASGPTLGAAVQRMTAADPGGRYGSLMLAADAMAAVVGRPALVGGHRFAPVLPRDLTSRPAAEAPAGPETDRAGTRAANAGRPGEGIGTSVFAGEAGVPRDAASAAPPANRAKPRNLARWLLAAAALGVTLGGMAPLSWWPW
jgi:hypothetical protein